MGISEAHRGYETHRQLCQRCRLHPFDPCERGAVLVEAAANSYAGSEGFQERVEDVLKVALAKGDELKRRGKA